MWKNLFTISKREQISFVILTCVLVLLFVGFFVSDGADDQPELDLHVVKWLESSQLVEPNIRKVSTFRFNPNNVTVKEMEQLGFSQNAILNIIKYREAGGRFVKPDKLREIYGVDSLLYERLCSYIDVDLKFEQATKMYKDERQKVYWVDLNVVDSLQLVKWGVSSDIAQDILKQAKLNYFSKRIDKNKLLTWTFIEWKHEANKIIVPKTTNISADKSFVIELNSADTCMLSLLKGVGPVLSKRIVAYRRKIGGFYSLNQLQEVYGVSPIVIQDNKNKVEVDSTLIIPMNISKVSLRQMKEHPYLDFYMAKEIYEARKNGSLNSITQFFASENFLKSDKNLLEMYFKVEK